MSNKEDSTKDGTSNDLEIPTKDVVDNFQSFYESTNFVDAIEAFSKVLKGIDIEPGPFHVFFPKFKSRLQPYLPYKYQCIWEVLDHKSKLGVYGNGIASKHSVLVVGAGPCGLRTALETQFLGATTIIVESRKEFTRNNVLKLWKFLIEDLKSLGFKSFCAQFCISDINHISIKQLQLVLSKICLMVGIHVAIPVKFLDICSPNKNGKGWTAKFDPESNEMSKYTFDMIFVATGKKVPKNIDGFDRQSLNAPLSIAVTGNFVNRRTPEEQSVKEISGLSKQYDQEFFADIEKDTGICLENIVYYKEQTHYFVMTATRESLLKRGVLMGYAGDRVSLFTAANVNKDNLHKYVTNAAQYSTKYLSTMLPTQEFALDHTGNPDVAVFDFTNLYYAKNASCVKEDMGHTLVMAAVGDSLLEPFWPEGTGCARGFLSAMNAAWMLRRLAEGRKISEITEEREKLYKVLKQTTDDSGGEVLKDEHASYTIDPKTRYKNAPQLMDEIKTKNLSRQFDVDKNRDCVTESQIHVVQKSREDRKISFSDTRKLFDQKCSSLKRQSKKPGTTNTDKNKRESSEKPKNTSKFTGKILSSGKRKGKETQTSIEDNRYETQEKHNKNPRSRLKKMNFINKIRRKRKGCEKDNLQENVTVTSKHGASIKTKRLSDQASKESDNKVTFRNGGEGKKPKSQLGDNQNKRITVANRKSFFEKLEEEAKQTDINGQMRPKLDEVDNGSSKKRKSQKSKCTIL